MIEIHNRIFIGCESECFENKEGWAVVHACKSPCHQRAVGYSGSLNSNHPNYLVLEKENNLYLNMIDPPKPLFKEQLFTRFLAFATESWKSGKKIFIHCNKGESRAPSLALLFLSKILEVISNESYEVAKREFLEIYPMYSPSQGIQIYLKKNWEDLNI